MAFGPRGGPQLRARIAALRQRLSFGDQEARAEEAGRRLDAEEVGKRADLRQAERQAEAARSDHPEPADDG